MTEINFNKCKKCGSNHVYFCENCAMGGCSKEGCEYQGVHYKRGGFLSSGGGICVRCKNMTKKI